MENDESIVNFRKRIFVVSVCTALVVIAAVGAYLLLANRGGKPVPAPRTVSFSGGTSETASDLAGEFVSLTPEQVKNGGIRIEEVGEGNVDTASGSVTGSGILQANAYRDVRVVAQVRGVLTTFTVEPGARISKGQVIGSATSDEFITAQTEYQTSFVAAGNAERAYARSLQLANINPAARSEYDAAVRESVKTDAQLAESKSRVERAERLVAIGAISKEAYESELSRFKSATADAAEASSRVQRASKVLDLSPEAKSQTEAALGELTKANGTRAAAKARLLILGVTEAEVAVLERGGTPSQTLALRAPISGTLLTRGIAQGEIFDTGRELFRVADTDELWFVAQILDKDASILKVGARVEVAVGMSSRMREGRVQIIEPIINEKTRTRQARITVRNPGGELLIGTFASLASVSSGEGTTRSAFVKTDSVQRIGEGNYVFIPRADGLTFELRGVRLGSSSEGITTVLEGVAKGEKVVTDGAFLLRAEYLKRRGN